MDIVIDTLVAQEWLGISLWTYAEACGVFLIALLVLKTFQLVVIARLRRVAKKTVSDIDDAIVEVIGSIRSFFYIVVALYIGLRLLPIPSVYWRWINTIAAFVAADSAIRVVSELMKVSVQQYLKRRFGDDVKSRKHTESIIRLMRVFLVFGLWGMAVLAILSNLGYNVTSMIASLGIGGIAIALAVQNVLSDIFSSFSLLIDKPFEVGDYIQIGQDKGTVQKIGMKTTRIKTLRGEELVVPNKELTTVRIQNFKNLDRRRESILISVVYSTPEKTLKKIPDIVAGIVGPIENVDFDRCHLKSLDASALTYEIVVFVNTEKFEEYMDIKQDINVGLLKEFKKAGVEFAYPTQTIYRK